MTPKHALAGYGHLASELCGSTIWSIRLCINLSRILNGDMGMYDLGSCAGLEPIWFWEGHDGSTAPGLRKIGSTETTREERT